MRITLLCFTAMLGCAAFSTAQGPARGPAPAVPAPDQTALKKHLEAWEREMKGLKTMSAVVTRIDTDKVFRATTKFTGWAAYMRAGGGKTATLSLAALELKPEGKNEIAEKIVSTGTYIYQYVPSRKEIHQHEIPRARSGSVSDDNFMGLAFGMKAEDALRRYSLTLHKIDANYIYVDIAPRTAADRADFQRARLVLNRQTYLPRQLWFESPNGNEVLWDLPAAKAGIALNRRWFDAPKPPPGWKIVPAPRAPAGGATPRVVRPSSGR